MLGAREGAGAALPAVPPTGQYPQVLSCSGRCPWRRARGAQLSHPHCRSGRQRLPEGLTFQRLHNRLMGSPRAGGREGSGRRSPTAHLPRGLRSHAASAFSMMETAMTASPLGNSLSSCLHSSCTTPSPSPGPNAAASTSPDSWSKPHGGSEGGGLSCVPVPDGGWPRKAASRAGGRQVELGTGLSLPRGWKERPSELGLTETADTHGEGRAVVSAWGAGAGIQGT